MVSGVLNFIVLNQCPVQVEWFYTGFWLVAVLVVVMCLVS